MTTALRLSGLSLVHRTRHCGGAWHTVATSDLGCLLGRGDDDDDDDDEDHHHDNHTRHFAVSSSISHASTTRSLLLAPSNYHLQQTTRRSYHATSQQPLVLYGAIIVVVATGYVIYRKSQGKPIAPDDLIDAKKEFRETGGLYSRAAFERRQAEKRLQKEAQQQQQQSSNINQVKDDKDQKSNQ